MWDYKSSTTAQSIRDYTENSLELVLDPFGEARTQRLCYQSLGRAGGKYIALEVWQPMNHTRSTVEPKFIMGSSIIGNRIALDNGYGCEADPEKRAFGIRFYREIQNLFDTKRLKPHPVKVVSGGWHGVLNGLELLKSRTLSAQKLVVFLGSP